MELIKSIFKDYNIEKNIESEVIKGINQKNLDSVKDILTNEQLKVVKVLIEKYDSISESIKAVESIAISKDTKNYINDFKILLSKLIELGYEDKILVDFSITSLDGYYSGIMFKGFVSKIASKVLSGGEYDNLLKKMNRKSGAIGFAVYLDELERLKEQREFEINASLVKLNNDIFQNEKGLGENDRIYIVAGSIIATLGIPNKVKPLEKSDLKSSTEKDNTIATVHGSLSHPSVSPANW